MLIGLGKHTIILCDQHCVTKLHYTWNICIISHISSNSTFYEIHDPNTLSVDKYKVYARPSNLMFLMYNVADPTF